MKVWKKQSVKWTKNGKRCKAGSDGATPTTSFSKRFYGTLNTYEGKRKQQPLTEDKKTSVALLKKLQHDEDIKRATGVNRFDVERQRPIHDHVDAYEKYLLAKGGTKQHVHTQLARIRLVLKTTITNTLAELSTSSITTTLVTWRNRKKKPISIETSNHYLKALNGFSRWLWLEKKTPDDILNNLRPLNADADRKRRRRALTQQELKLLVETTSQSKKTVFGFKPNDRAILYTLAAYTGLRASELASLTKASINLETMTVSVDAAYSKRRRNDTVPLHPSLREPLEQWLKGKDKGVLFPKTYILKFRSARLLRRDLERCDIASEGEDGRRVDFHALRHTFVSSLAKAGVHPLKAKELARHSTITLTMDVYSHLDNDELRGALNTLPPLS